MASTLVFRRAAQCDLEEIEAYLDEKSAQAAVNVLTDIHDVITLLSNFPLIGRHLEGRDARVKLSTRYHYQIVYSVDGDSVIIRQIVHSSRDMP